MKKEVCMDSVISIIVHKDVSCSDFYFWEGQL